MRRNPHSTDQRRIGRRGDILSSRQRATAALLTDYWYIDRSDKFITSMVLVGVRGIAPSQYSIPNASQQ
eukprot:scaffold45318_cov32-Attheya_sp.AAC.1